MKRIVLTLVLILSSLATSLCPLVNAEENASSFQASSQAAIAFQSQTGQVLYSKNTDQKLMAGSLTKLITAYMVYQAIEKEDVSWSTEVDITDYPYYLTVNPNTTNVLLEKRKYTIDQLMDAMLVASSDSAAIALAERVGGTEKDFVDQMKKQLEEWGIKNANLINASGLSNELLGENRYPGSKLTDANLLSAKDLALVSYHLLKDYPDVLKRTSKSSIKLDNKDYQTTNLFLANQVYFREGVQGLAPAYSAKGGASLITYASVNQTPIVTIVLNVDKSSSDPSLRYSSTNQLLTYIGQAYTPLTIVKKGESYQNQTVTIQDGAKDQLTPIAEEDFIYLQSSRKEEPEIYFSPLDQITPAPIKKAQNLATLTLKVDRKDYLTGQVPQVNLLADQSLDKAIFFKVWWNQFVRYVNENL